MIKQADTALAIGFPAKPTQKSITENVRAAKKKLPTARLTRALLQKSLLTWKKA